MDNNGIQLGCKDDKVSTQSYLDVDDINDWLNTNNTQGQFNFMHVNIRGLFGKQQILRDMVSSIECDSQHLHAVGICESLLKNHMLSSLNLSSYNILTKNRECKGGGGACLLVKKSFNPILIEVPYEESIFESIAVEININKHEKLLLIELYRAPNTNVKKFNEHYQKLLQICKNYRNVIIGTDSNLNLLKSDTHAQTESFLHTNLEFGYTPQILLPTRITHKTASLIDNVFVSPNHSDSAKSTIINSDISDHLPCLVQLVTKGTFQVKTYHRKDTSQQNLLKVKEQIDSIDLNICIDDTQDLDTCINNFTECIQIAIDDNCPEIEVCNKIERCYKSPWITESMLKSSIKSQRLYGKVKTLAKDHPKYQHYVSYRNILNKLRRNAKRLHLKKILENSGNNSIKLWNAINIALNRVSNKKDLPSEFKIDGKITDDLKLVTNAFCKYYAEVGERTEKKVKQTNRTYHSYLKKSTENNFYCTPATEHEVAKLIKNLKNKSSHGEDAISNKLLKLIQENVVTPLTYLINRSIKENYFPKIFKHAIVKPLFKSGDNQLIENYRPISLLRVISKLIERVVNDRLVNYLEKYKLLSDHQYGFRKNRSTVDATLDYFGTILDKLNNKETVFTAMIDLSKAFDVLKKNVILDKLNHYGVRGSMLMWFDSFLSNRTISVQINDIKSDTECINLGTPQGGVISPTLFSIVINNLENCLKYSKGILFADDTTIISSGHGPKIAYARFKHDMTEICDWFRANKLLMNTLKSKLLIYKNSTIKINFDTSITLDGEKLIESSSAKLLGITFDSNCCDIYHYVRSKDQTNLGTKAHSFQCSSEPAYANSSKLC